jgi:Flp pilus assembly protein TadB
MSYAIELIWPAAPLGAVALLMVPFVGAMLVVAVVLLVAVAILVALVGAIVAMLFLVARAVRRRRRRRRRSGRALPAYTAQAKVRKLTAAGEQTVVPEAPAAPVR